MYIALSFIGKMPEYAVDCVHQIRLFFDGNVYLIMDDLASPYVNEFKRYGVNIVPYASVVSDEFNVIMQNNAQKFLYLQGLVGREQLFMRSFERFFLLYNLMTLLTDHCEDCLFIEIDNLIYDDPRKWQVALSKSQIAYMYDNDDRFASGIFYARDAYSLRPLLDTMKFSIFNSDQPYFSEMHALHMHYQIQTQMQQQNPGAGITNPPLQILPTHWPINANANAADIPEITYKNFGKYRSIFDAAAIGVFICDMDPFHTNSVVKTGLRNHWSKIDYTGYEFKWIRDEQGRNRPYVHVGSNWILINNLHAHSKDLRPYLSKGTYAPYDPPPF